MSDIMYDVNPPSFIAEPTIEDIESQIQLLLEKRKCLIEEQGGQERYFVWNSKTEKIDHRVWCLSADSLTDKVILDDIVRKHYYSGSWKTYIRSWLEDVAVSDIDLSEVEDI